MFFKTCTSKEVGIRRVNKPVEVNKRTFCFLFKKFKSIFKGPTPKAKKDEQVNNITEINNEEIFDENNEKKIKEKKDESLAKNRAKEKEWEKIK